jgi:hypothetical protein
LEKEAHPTWDYFKLLLFVVFLAELALFFMAIIFGRLIGYDWALTACFWIGILVAACFILIVSLNLIIILCQKIFRTISEKGFTP